MLRDEKAAVLIAAQAGIPPLLWGPPGQGKSSFIRKGFAELGYTVKVIRVNTILPHHLSGSPVPDQSGEMIRYLAPAWAVELNKAERSIVFFDDLSCASSGAQTATFGLMDERAIGDLKLKAIPIAAANPNSLATARFEIDGASANRFVHIFITSNGEMFRDDALAGFPVGTVPKLKRGWERLIPKKIALVGNFLASTEGVKVVNAMPELMTPTTVAWPSERSWEFFWTILAACDSLDPESIIGINLRTVRSTLLQGCVGRGAYAMFNAYFLNPMSAKVDDALNRGKRFSFPEGGDEMFGLMEAVANKLAAGGVNQKQWDNAWSLVEGAWDTSHRDRTVTLVLDLLSLGRSRFALPGFYTKNIFPFLNAA